MHHPLQTLKSSLQKLHDIAEFQAYLNCISPINRDEVLVFFTNLNFGHQISVEEIKNVYSLYHCMTQRLVDLPELWEVCLNFQSAVNNLT
jgi:hypothetical protein